MEQEKTSTLKRGYLTSDFEFFHIKDEGTLEFEPHYHDFNKIIIFLSGDVTYLIEGKSYKLKPWDILFVSRNDVHKPIISKAYPYERVILWINSAFLQLYNRNNSSLENCFDISSKEKLSLLRLNAPSSDMLKACLYNLETAVKDKDFASEVLKDSAFLQFMVYINRLFLRTEFKPSKEDIQYDERTTNIIDYINSNLEGDLSIDFLASKFYMNKYFLMHKFKTETGYTLHNYINQKRLIKASSLIKQGIQITEVYLNCGFNDYSSFVRAFHKVFGMAPKSYYKINKHLEKNYSPYKHK